MFISVLQTQIAVSCFLMFSKIQIFVLQILRIFRMFEHPQLSSSNYFKDYYRSKLKEYRVISIIQMIIF